MVSRHRGQISLSGGAASFRAASRVGAAAALSCLAVAVLGQLLPVSAQRAPQAPSAAPASSAPAPALAQQPPSGQPPITFYDEVNFIEVDTFVSDRAGNPVTTLSKDDFELFEDGARQQIDSFSAVNIPIVRPERPLYATKPIEPDVRTNLESDGRVYLILLDDIHIKPSRVPNVRAALHSFIERNFGANDLAAVVRVRSATDSQDFTNNPQLLLRAIDRFTGNVPRDAVPTTETTTDASQTAAALPNVGVASASDLETAHDARNVAGRLRELAEFLASIRGRRKSLIFVSEGSPFDTYASLGQLGAVASTVIADTRKAIAAATRGNVTVYTIDPRGLVSMDPDDLSASVAPTGEGMRLAQNSLREMATETGGFAAVNVNNLDKSFERIVRENSAYYILGYASTAKTDGGYRKLEVRVKRPGLQVRARNGYTSADSKTRPAAARPSNAAVSPALSRALASPLPTNGLPLRVFAAAYRGTSKVAHVIVALELEASTLDFVEKNGVFSQEVELAHATTDPGGKARTPARQKLTFNLSRASHQRAMDGGVRVLSSLELPPGRHQLRVAASTATGKSGTVFFDLDVPDFNKPALAMSSLSLMSSRSAEGLMVVTKALPQGLSLPVVTARDFDAGATVALFGEVYENGKGPVHTVDITTELRTDAGRVVRASTDRRSSEELAGKSGGYGFSAAVPLKDLPPGLYVVHAEARANVGTRPTVSRDVQIRIR